MVSSLFSEHARLFPQPLSRFSKVNLYVLHPQLCNPCIFHRSILALLLSPSSSEVTTLRHYTNLFIIIIIIIKHVYTVSTYFIVPYHLSVSVLYINYIVSKFKACVVFLMFCYSAVCFFIYLSFRAVVSAIWAFLYSLHQFCSLLFFYCIVSVLINKIFIDSCVLGFSQFVTHQPMCHLNTKHPLNHSHLSSLSKFQYDLT